MLGLDGLGQFSRPQYLAPGIVSAETQFTQNIEALTNLGVQMGNASVQLNEEGVRVVKFSSGIGGDTPVTLLPTGVGAINCALQQGREVIAGPLVGGDVALARNAQGLQLALATDRRLDEFEEYASELEILAHTTTKAPDQLANALAPGRFQIALLSPMPTTISLIDLAPVTSPLFGSTDRPATSGELYVVGVTAQSFH